MKKLPTNSLAHEATRNSAGYKVDDGVTKMPNSQPASTMKCIAGNELTIRDASAPESCKGIIEVALKIARNRSETLDKIRSAFSRNDNVEVLRLAKELCGIKDDKEMHRTDSRVH